MTAYVLSCTHSSRAGQIIAMACYMAIRKNKQLSCNACQNTVARLVMVPLSFPLSLLYFMNYTGYRCRRPYILRFYYQLSRPFMVSHLHIFQPLNASPPIISDPTQVFYQSHPRVRCQKFLASVHFRRRRFIYYMLFLVRIQITLISFPP